MGTVLGAYMTKNGCEVELIDNYKEHVDTLNRCGAVINVLTDSKGVTAAMHDAGWEVPVMSTCATGTAVSCSPETYSPNRSIYRTGWSDNTGGIMKRFILL